MALPIAMLGPGEAGMELPIWARSVRVKGATKDALGELDVPVTVGEASIRFGA